ncbi:MAG: Arc family DNA-binding protein [Lachnospiraceae bacterium]|nr:Arc family DNA-binding protein [Lachnospiraceae bacterium]
MSPQKNEKDKEKKQVLLRLSQTLWTDLAEWAEDDFRSINGQIEYLLTEAVRKRKQSKRRGEARKEQEALE